MSYDKNRISVKIAEHANPETVGKIYMSIPPPLPVHLADGNYVAIIFLRKRMLVALL